jgi:hypothetical protein
MEVNPDYKIFDADSHYYEPDDCFTGTWKKHAQIARSG